MQEDLVRPSGQVFLQHVYYGVLWNTMEAKREKVKKCITSDKAKSYFSSRWGALAQNPSIRLYQSDRHFSCLLLQTSAQNSQNKSRTSEKTAAIATVFRLAFRQCSWVFNKQAELSSVLSHSSARYTFSTPGAHKRLFNLKTWRTIRDEPHLIQNSLNNLICKLHVWFRQQRYKHLFHLPERTITVDIWSPKLYRKFPLEGGPKNARALWIARHNGILMQILHVATFPSN